MADDTTPSVPPSDPTPGGDTPPAVVTRSELQASKSGAARPWLWAVVGVVVVLLAGGIALAATSSSQKKADAAPTTTAAAAAPVAQPTTCPLTGTPAPNGVVPARPALGIKIGNLSDGGQADDDRPSSGLNQADVVFEEPVEGTITRLVAVFQCQSATLVGDIRSTREPDVGIMSQFSDPLFAHAGGIDPVIALVAAAPLKEMNLLDGTYDSATLHQSGRYAPYATFVNTNTLWALAPTDTTPPAPIFTFSPAPPAGTVAGSGGSVHIPFSQFSDVTWDWSPTQGTYLRNYAYGPDKLMDGSQTSATNVIVMTVPTTQGPWVENSEGGLEVQINPIGSGPATVLRGGVAIAGTWTRTSLTSPTKFTTAAGQPISLAPGNTWEELAPQGVPVTTAPVAPPAAPAPANG